MPTEEKSFWDDPLAAFKTKAAPDWYRPIVKSEWQPGALEFFNRKPSSVNEANVQAMEDVLASDAFTTYYEVGPDGKMRQIEKPADINLYQSSPSPSDWPAPSQVSKPSPTRKPSASISISLSPSAPMPQPQFQIMPSGEVPSDQPYIVNQPQQASYLPLYLAFGVVGAAVIAFALLRK